MPFESESHFEAYIRMLIYDHITNGNNDIFALTNKKAIDILICKNGPVPHLYFIEAKFHIDSHGRLGFGSKRVSAFSRKFY